MLSGNSFLWWSGFISLALAFLPSPGIAQELQFLPGDASEDSPSFQQRDEVEPTFFQESSPTAKPAPPAAKPAAPATRPAAAPATPPRTLPPPSPPTNPYLNNPQQQFTPNNQRSLARMSRSPDMFGDTLSKLTAQIKNANGNLIDVDVPFSGGSYRFKNEHGQAIPVDRVFGLYHHFVNAMEVKSSVGAPGSAGQNVDRYTLGFEKTFLDQNASVEVRLPMSSPIGLTTTDTVFQSDVVGNLVVSLKGLLYADDEQAFAVGLAAVAPTGSDATVRSPTSGASGASFTVENNAAHFVPFVVFQATPTDDFFLMSYLQLDTPTNANSVRSSVTTGSTSPNLDSRFEVTSQALLYADISIGHWWFRDSESPYLSGLASLLELHYTTQLNSPDAVSRRDEFLSFGNKSSGDDVLNLTFGLHAELTQSTFLRVGYVTPLRDENHRFFDNEITLALVYRR